MPMNFWIKGPWRFQNLDGMISVGVAVAKSTKIVIWSQILSVLHVTEPTVVLTWAEDIDRRTQVAS